MFFEGILLFQDLGFTVLSVARRGDYLRENFHFDMLTGDMEKILKHFGISRAHIIASSLGTVLALKLAARVPQKIVSVTTIGGFLKFPWIFAHDLLYDLLAALKIKSLPVRDLGVLSPQMRYVLLRSLKIVKFILVEYELFPLASFLTYMKKIRRPSTDPCFFCTGSSMKPSPRPAWRA